ncbi:MAG: ABC transporter substrate-binding protein, partial [Actinomycetota bacterium]|nr:ABC transporter substrate-binding protein [Actinomycetota bacterium]
LNVTTKDLNGGAAAVPALQGNAIQVAQSNVLSVIQGANQGLKVPCFAGAFNANGAGISLPLIAGGKGGVTKASDLVGKSVAVNATGGVNELATDAYLASQGVDYKQVKYVATPYPNMPQAVSAGQVDAVVPADPFAGQILAKGGKLLTNNVVASVAGNPIYACWNASADWLAKNPVVAKNFVAALTEASAAVTADFTSFKDYLKTKGNIPAALADNVAGLEFTTTMSNNDVTKWQDAGKKYGILTDGNADTAKVYQPVTG